MLLALVTSLPRLLGTAWDVVREDARRRADGLADRRPRRRLRPLAPGAGGGAAGARWPDDLHADRGALVPRPHPLEPRVRAQAGHGRRRRRGRRDRPLLGLGAAARAPTGRSAPTRRDCSPPCFRARRTMPGWSRCRRSVPRHSPRGAASSSVRRPSVGWPARARCRRPSRRDGRCPAGPTRSWRWCSSRPVTPAPGGPPRHGGTDEAAEPWVFPFDKPLPPAEGDNQAGAYNTTDGTVTYDVAFALVWATGDEVLNVNEAHAYASCSDCVTVAVAFQVVLIMDDARVVVPQNLSVAANYDCYRCITAAHRQPARAVRGEDAGTAAAAGARRGLGSPDRVRESHHVVLADGDLGPAAGLQGGDRRDPRRRATGAARRDDDDGPARRRRRRPAAPTGPSSSGSSADPSGSPSADPGGASSDAPTGAAGSAPTSSSTSSTGSSELE